MMRSRHSNIEAIASILRASTSGAGISWGSGHGEFSSSKLQQYLSFLLAHKLIALIDSGSPYYKYQATDKGVKLLRVIDSIL